jgi:Fas apoptotic inhibitory molecule (FAIM1)
MAKKIWTVTLEDGEHTIELEHDYISGKRDIYVDGTFVKLSHGSTHYLIDFGSNHPFKIGGHCCIIHIRTNGITFSFDLSVDGRSISTGKQVDSSNSVPSWVWAFVLACGIIPIISLGGAVPALIGSGGAAYCYSISQDTSKKMTTRIFMCFGVTAICWSLFIGLILAIRK